jgi:ferredoxin-thioredoxin reductase catalytic subunit
MTMSQPKPAELRLDPAEKAILEEITHELEIPKIYADSDFRPNNRCYCWLEHPLMN